MSDIIAITPAAIGRVRHLLSAQDPKPLGIKVGVKQGGCSGLSYTFDYCHQLSPGDEVVQAQDVSVVVDSKAVMFIIGTTLDYVDEKVKSGFIFRNPNETGRCGCGSSFSVK